MEQPESTLQQLMFSLIQVWKSSGKTQKEFCAEKELAYSKFQYWMRMYQKSQAPGEPKAFLSVSVKKGHSAPRGSSAVELCFPDGRRLIFHQGVDVSFLRSLLA